jgi:hypothetical protein
MSKGCLNYAWGRGGGGYTVDNHVMLYVSVHHFIPLEQIFVQNSMGGLCDDSGGSSTRGHIYEALATKQPRNYFVRSQ